MDVIRLKLISNLVFNTCLFSQEKRKCKYINKNKKYKPNQISNFFQYYFLFISCVEELRDIYLMWGAPYYDGLPRVSLDWLKWVCYCICVSECEYMRVSTTVCNDVFSYLRHKCSLEVWCYHHDRGWRPLLRNTLGHAWKERKEGLFLNVI